MQNNDLDEKKNGEKVRNIEAFFCIRLGGDFFSKL